LKLGRSTFSAWSDFEGGRIEELQSLFDAAETPLVDGWKAGNLLVEVMLIEGFPLDSRIERLKTAQENEVLVVETGHLEHRLVVCLDNKIKTATVRDLSVGAEDVFVCLDSAMTDELKLRLKDRCTVRTI
jgi:adenine-specific DNA-methyltransferase